MALLEIRKLSKRFGGLAALQDINLDVHESEILGVIGPNGAGKSTLFNVVTGLLPPSDGKVLWDGEDITGLRADQIVRKGIGRTFQASVLFMQATVFDNVFTAFHIHHRKPGWKAFFHTSGARREEREIMREVGEILEFMGIASVKDRLAINLPHGYQRILGVCLSLATRPRLLLLDEPMTGMNPVETSRLVDLVRKIRDRGMTVAIVEHDMKAIMSLSDRVVVLNYGNKIAEGNPEEILQDRDVIEAYLGAEETADDS